MPVRLRFNNRQSVYTNWPQLRRKLKNAEFHEGEYHSLRYYLLFFPFSLILLCLIELGDEYIYETS